ncbi:MAG: hypothetical protein ACI8T1_001649 [Verrucomicrobiales bacterium]|jgi:hypothetical protein
MMRVPPFLYSLIPCLFASMLSLSAQQDTILVFNELMYHPAETTSTEWVELVNLNRVDVDISHWSLEGAVKYTFPKGTIARGNSYLVVAGDPSQVPDSMGPFTGRLDDGGEELRLLNNSGRVMCILDYNDRGDWPVAPDGSGVSLAKKETELLATDASSWHWSAEMGGTPGSINFPGGLVSPIIQFNEIAGQGEESFFVELGFCPCPDPLTDAILPLEGYRVQTSGGETFTFTDQSVVVGSVVSVTGETLGFQNLLGGDRLFLLPPTVDRVLDAVVLRQRTRARFPDGEAWHIATENTPGEPNQVILQDAIVINEIMYHHRPTYEGETEGQLYQKNPEEWIELTNRSDAAVDLTDWSLDGAVGFDFPDGTMLAPGAFLVIAGDAESLRAKHPGITVVGDFSGTLNNDRARVALRDSTGNPADEVTYFDGGSWPGNADAGGSSLELRHPGSDNAKPGSWAASDEGSKSEWKNYSYRGVAERPAGTNFPSSWDEFNFGLLDAGEFLIDDVTVIEDPAGAANGIIRNRSFAKSIFGGDGTQSWLFRGNHGGHGKTVIVNDPTDDENTVLHVVATGATEHMHNQVETTLSGNTSVSPGTEYEISFRAKWLGGSPMLHTRLYFNYLAKKTILAMPATHGTPGAINSTFEENLGPAYTGLTHFPAVGIDNEPVTITVDATDPDGIESLTVMWSNNGTDFDSIPMTLVNGEQYQAQLPALPAKNLFGAFNETKIQFYIEGKDSKGATTWWPKEGPESRALIPLEDGRQGEGPGRNLRIVMTDADTERLHETINVMSNHRMPCTVIDGEQRVYYNAAVRLKGSERGRNQAVRAGFSLKMPSDDPYRGLHGTIAVDRSGAGNQFSQKEILVKHAINRAGDIPGMYDDLIFVVSPDPRHTGSAMLLMARYDNEYLEGLFENGGDGQMFEYELIYYPTTDDADGYKRPEPDAVSGVNHRNLGPDKETYRWHYLVDMNRDADDYTRVMDMLDLFGSSNDANYIERLHATIDVDQWLRSYAIQNLFGIGDNYANGSQHNMIMYFPPGGKAMYFPWDMDFTFNQGATSSIASNGDLNNMLDDPTAFRSYYAQMDELLQTVFNKGYMESWAEHYSTFLPSENLASFVNYIDQRNRHVAGQLRSRFENVPFAITSMDGGDFEVASSTLTLEGQGWYNVASVQVNGVDYDLTWVDRDRWELVLPLALGENTIEVQSLDVLGTKGSLFAPMGKDTITVTNTGSAASASVENLVISEIMYHPASPSAAEIEAGFTSQDEFEFIELQNVSDSPIDLTGVRFTRGIDYDFPEGTLLEAGGYLVLVENAEAFASRYPGITAKGVYSGQLRNSGETIRLRAVDDRLIQEFSYNDADPWPSSADGEGRSLVLTGPADKPDPDLPESWAASSAAGGSPGTGEVAPEPNAAFEAWLATRGGNALADPTGDGVSLLEEYAMGLDIGGSQPSARLAIGGAAEFVFQTRTADGVSVSVQTSDDLITWKSASDAGTLTDLGNGLTQVVLQVIESYARLQITP